MNGTANHKLIVVTGATATGKTRLAAWMAHRFNGEIISGDSRQVYRGMDIGTGKDLADYKIGDQPIPYHLIDIHDPGHEYNIHDFGHDFRNCLTDIQSRGKQPLLCGGSGLYIEAALKDYASATVPENKQLRDELSKLTPEELRQRLMSSRTVHNTTDLIEKERLIRAIEIAEFPVHNTGQTVLRHMMIGLKLERGQLRQNITSRLMSRLDNGMVEETRSLLGKGIPPESLIFYGLEYKYLTLFVTGKLSYEQMATQLNTAIHQFAKRQETWFRRMERQGFVIHWIDASLPFTAITNTATQIIENEGR